MYGEVYGKKNKQFQVVVVATIDTNRDVYLNPSTKTDKITISQHLTLSRN